MDWFVPSWFCALSQQELSGEGRRSKGMVPKLMAQRGQLWDSSHPSLAGPCSESERLGKIPEVFPPWDEN